MLLLMANAKPSRMGFVLAGGKSSRMGSDKAFLETDGQTLLDRALDALDVVCSCVKIVGDPDKFAIRSHEIRASSSGYFSRLRAAWRHSCSACAILCRVEPDARG